jgi:hypothetical protein
MPSDYFHGSRTIEYSEGPRYIRTMETAVIGAVVVADDADNTVFPLGDVAGFAGYDPELIGKAGDTGTLAHTLDAIYDQGISPLTAIVRVADSTNHAELLANVQAGCHKLLAAQSRFGFTPRIIGAPGLDKKLEVAKELEAVAERLLAFAYLGVEADDEFEAVTYRNNFGSDRVMLIWPDFKNSTSTLYASARALGLRAKIDNDIGWHKTLSNVPVLGVNGLSHDVSWNLQTSDHAAHHLNSHEVTTLINEQGQRFWGNRTTAPQGSDFVFENYRRTGDVLGYSFAQAMFSRVDAPMSKGLILDIIASINQKYQQLTNDGYILGGKCWIKQSDNLGSAVLNGKLVIARNYTPVPPLEDLTQKQIITDEFVVNLF